MPPGGRVGEPKTTPPPGAAPAKWPRDLDENAILKNTEFQRFDEQNIMSYKTMNNKIGARTARRRERSFAGGGLRKRPRRLDEKQKTQRRVDEKPGLSRGGAKAATAPRREAKNATARRREARFCGGHEKKGHGALTRSKKRIGVKNERLTNLSAMKETQLQNEHGA